MVTEFFNKIHVRYGLLAVGAAMVRALLMMSFILFLSSGVQIPLINMDDFLLGEVLFTLGGYLFVSSRLAKGCGTVTNQRG